MVNFTTRTIQLDRIFINYANGSATSYDADNTAFLIGNGTDDSNRSDAFKVMFNGDTTVGGDITISSMQDLSQTYISWFYTF